MVRMIRRGPRGTRLPHLTARPTGAAVLDLVPSPEGDLHGAACSTLEPELFFPDDADEFSARRAVAVCSTCPVRDACLALAMRRYEKHGIFGGLTADERRKLHRKTMAALRATRADGGAA